MGLMSVNSQPSFQSSYRAEDPFKWKLGEHARYNAGDGVEV